MLYGRNLTYDVIVKSTIQGSYTAFLIGFPKDHTSPSSRLKDGAVGKIFEVQSFSKEEALVDLSLNILDQAVKKLSSKLIRKLGKLMGMYGRWKP
jgi:hypothetical protein